MNLQKRIDLLILAALCTPLAHADCLGMAVHAHRGAPGLPENSIASVKAVMAGGWDGAELDLQRLGDQEWVLHHDWNTERTVITGAPRRVAELTSPIWRNARMRGSDGKASNEPAPFLKDLLPLSQEHPATTLNLEIKQENNGSCDPVNQLIKQLQAGLGHANWLLTSTDRRNLRCARKAQPDVYLGVIVIDPKSAAELVEKVRGYSNVMPVAKISLSYMEEVRNQLKPATGLHVDVRSLPNNPSLLSDAKAIGLPIFTYSLRGDEEHINLLNFYAKKADTLPSGVIIDGDAASFCATLRSKLAKKGI